jgi:proline iminopeptidase
MIAPDMTRISVGAHDVVAHSYGAGDEILFLLSGGPGLPVSHLSTPFLPLAEQGYRIIAYDQLGTGESDRPDDPGLWRIERYVDEVEMVRRALGLGRIHLIGHSWGGWLAIEYALMHGDALATLTLSNTCADMPHLRTELERLKQGLGPETYARIVAHEAGGRYEHPEYKAAMTLLYAQHVRRLDPVPEPIVAAVAEHNLAPYHAIQGPNEFVYVGNLRNWSRLADLSRVTVPTLVLCGRYDEMTPACAALMACHLPDARVEIFPNSSHVPFYEEPDAYFAVLTDFLARHVVR